MGTRIYSSTPRVVLEGIRDLSTRVVPPEPEAQPQHLPLFYTFAEKGSDKEAVVVSGSALTDTFGTKFLDMKSPYATHATPFIRGINAEGNMIMLKRLRPEGAKTAWIRFALEVIKQPILKDGEVEGPDTKYGYWLKWVVNPKLSPTVEANLSPTVREQYKFANNFGQGLTVADIGLLTDDTPDNPLATGILTYGDKVSRVYPIFDFQVTDFGEYGNNLGMRLYAPNLKTNKGQVDEKFFRETLVRMFSVEFIQRKNPRSPAITVDNLYGETSSDFCLKRGQTNPFSNHDDVYLGTALLDLYRNEDTSFGRIPTYGPFNAIKVYDSNIEHILKTLYAAELEEDELVALDIAKRIADDEAERIRIATEKGYYLPQRDPSKPKVVDFGRVPSKLNFDLLEGELGPRLIQRTRLGDETKDDLMKDAHWQIDLMSAKDIKGNNYRRIFMVSMAQDGKSMTKDTDYWASGGADGEMSNKTYNELVSLELQQFAKASNKMLDIARFPFSVFYDTGYPLHMKQEDLPILIQARKDVSICLSTHEVNDDPSYYPEDGVAGVTPLKSSRETAILRALLPSITAFPESTVYGTRACRANIIMQCGSIIGDGWKGRVPMVYELAMKRARYMGASDGKMRPGAGYDQDGVKQLQFIKQANNPFVPDVVREINWTHGATWAQFYDRNLMFFPAVRTVYRDETSVLLSDINMLIATDLQKVCFRTWRRLVGDAKLTNEQFIQRSDQLITEDTEGRYDGRVVIRPETYYTKADELRGFLWHCNVHMYAPNMKTVGVMAVVTHRLDELQG